MQKKLSVAQSRRASFSSLEEGCLPSRRRRSCNSWVGRELG